VRENIRAKIIRKREKIISLKKEKKKKKIKE